MFHGIPFAVLAALALVAGAVIGMGWVVFRDGRAARRMDRRRT